MAQERLLENTLGTLLDRSFRRKRVADTSGQRLYSKARLNDFGKATETTLAIEDMAKRVGKTDFEPFTILPDKR